MKILFYTLTVVCVICGSVLASLCFNLSGHWYVSIFRILLALAPFALAVVCFKKAQGKRIFRERFHVTKKGIGRIAFVIAVAACLAFEWASNDMVRVQPPENRWSFYAMPMAAFAWAGIGRARRIGISAVWGVLCGIPFLGLMICLVLLLAPDSKPSTLSLTNNHMSFFNDITERIAGFLKTFARLPAKQKGIALIVASIFVFVAALLFSTNEWDSRDSFLQNVGHADIEVFEVNARYPYNNWFLIDVPLKLIAFASLAMASLGFYFVLSARSPE